jgi:ribosomal protein S27AE
MNKNRSDFEKGFLCPKCGSATNTYRHPNAKRWCGSCGFVLREEGDTFYDYKQHINSDCNK